MYMLLSLYVPLSYKIHMFRKYLGLDSLISYGRIVAAEACRLTTTSHVHSRKVSAARSIKRFAKKSWRLLQLNKK